MNRVPSAYLILSITQAYSIFRKKSKKSTDPVKSLIEKQQKYGYTEDNIIQRIQTNPFPYDIIWSQTAEQTILLIFVAQITAALNLL